VLVARFIGIQGISSQSFKIVFIIVFISSRLYPRLRRVILRMKWIFRDERDTKFFSFFVPLFVSLDFQIIIPRMMNKTKLILYIILLNNNI
jgi:hypothetical protein